MTISTTTDPTITYDGNGITVDFNIPFEFQLDTDLVVVHTDALDNETTWVLDSDYTIDVNNSLLTATVAPLTLETLTITRYIPLTQETDLKPYRQYNPELIEDALDKLTLITQDLKSTPLSFAADSELLDGLNSTQFLRSDIADIMNGALTALDNINLESDTAKLQIGAGNDLKLYHDGTNSLITNDTGNLRITTASGSQVIFNEDGTDVDFRIESDNVQNMFLVDASTDRIGINQGTPTEKVHIGGGGTLYHQGASYASGKLYENFDSGHNAYRLTTNGATEWLELTTNNSTNGIHIDPSGNVNIPLDSVPLQIGAGNDLKLYHDGTNSFITNVSGGLKISTPAGNEVVVNEDGAASNFRVEASGNANMLLVDGTNNLVGIGTAPNYKFHVYGGGTFMHQGAAFASLKSYETNANGHNAYRMATDSPTGWIEIMPGDSNTLGIQIDGSGNTYLRNDTAKLNIGAGDDLQSYHNGTDSYIYNNTGDLYFRDPNANGGTAISLTDLYTSAGALESLVTATTTIVSNGNGGANDNVDVSAVGSILCNTAGGNVILGGLTGGVTGQKLIVYKSNVKNVLIIENEEGVGDQDITTQSGNDLYISPWGGCVLEFNGTSWHIVTEGEVGTRFRPDSANPDQGVASSSGKGLTVYDITQLMGVNDFFTVIFSQGETFTFDTSIDLSAYINASFIFEPGATFVQDTGDETVTFYAPLQITLFGRDVIGPIDMFVFDQDIVRNPTVFVFPWISSAVSNVKTPSGLWLDVSASTTNGLQEGIDYAYGDGTAGTASYNLEIVSRQREDTGGAIRFFCSTTLQFPAVRQATLVSGGFTISSSASPAIQFDSLFQCKFDFAGAEIDSSVGTGPIVLFQPTNIPPQEGSGQIGIINSEISFGTIAATVNMTAGEENAILVFDGDNGYISGNKLTVLEINGSGMANTIGLSFINVDFNSIYNEFFCPNIHGITTSAIQIGDAVADMDHLVSNTFNVGGYPHALATGIGVDCYARKNIINIYHLFTNPSISFATDLYLRSTAQNNIIKAPLLTNITDSSDGSNRLMFSQRDSLIATGTDQRLARYNGTNAIEDSGITISNVDAISGITDLTVDNININGNTLTSTSGDTLITSAGTQVVVNENGADIDFRVESTGSANMLTVDAGNDRVGIYATPSERFQIGGGGTLYHQGASYSSLKGYENFDNGHNAYRLTTNGATEWLEISTNNATNTGIHIDTSGNVLLPSDSTQLKLGAGQDLLLYHDGTNSLITNSTGDLQITTAAGSEVVINESGADVDLRVESTGSANMLTVDAGNDRVGIYATPSERFQIGGGGTFYHQGASYASLKGYETQTSGHNVYRLTTNGATEWLELTVNNSTSGLHIDTSGNLVIPSDTAKLQIGVGNDLALYHDGTNTLVENVSTGDLYVRNLASGASSDLIFSTANGAISLQTQNGVNISSDNVAIQLGASNDLSIYHDGTNSLITNSTGNLRITTASGSQIVVNEDGTDVDFRIESDNLQNMFLVDASADCIGINQGSPTEKLHIGGGGKIYHQGASYASGKFYETNASGNLAYRITTDSGAGQWLELTTNDSGNGIHIDSVGNAHFQERSADPSDPAEGTFVIWMSDGTGSGDDGDIMLKITAGATTKTITLVDFSAF